MNDQPEPKNQDQPVTVSAETPAKLDQPEDDDDRIVTVGEARREFERMRWELWHKEKRP
jgi:hypothetical protein